MTGTLNLDDEGDGVQGIAYPIAYFAGRIRSGLRIVQADNSADVIMSLVPIKPPLRR